MPALKPLPSSARVLANRANAAKSTGPKTEAGKARSRRNALRHGLTGAGIALPIEEEEAVAAQFAAVQEELAPTTALGGYFARRVALAMVRSDRAARHEAKALAHRIRHAAEEFDQARRALAQAALDRLESDPHPSRRVLLALPEGVDRLIETLLDLRACAARAEPDWSVEHEALLRNACGWRDEELAPARGFALSRAILGDRRLLSGADRRRAQVPVEPGTPTRLGLMLAEVIEEEVHRLQDHRSTLDHATIALDRAEAAERAAFDPSPAAALARRYEAAAVREVRQALDQFHRAEAAAPELTPTTDAPPAIDDPASAEAAPPEAEAETEAEAEIEAEPIEEATTTALKSLADLDLVAPLASFGGEPLAPALDADSPVGGRPARRLVLAGVLGVG